MLDANRILAGICALLGSAGLILGGAALKFAIQAERSQAANAVEMRHVQQTLRQLSAGSDADDRQNATDAKHWRYLSHLHAEINKTNHAAGLPPIAAPNLGND